jgi:hypothetical protein
MDETEDSHRQNIGANRITERVSEEQRRDNAYWIKQRDQWRKEYRIISKHVKQAKIHYAKRPNKETAFRLQYTSHIASELMAVRMSIRIGLIDSAYPYV